MSERIVVEADREFVWLEVGRRPTSDGRTGAPVALAAEDLDVVNARVRSGLRVGASAGAFALAAEDTHGEVGLAVTASAGLDATTARVRSGLRVGASAGAFALAVEGTDGEIIASVDGHGHGDFSIGGIRLPTVEKLPESGHDGEILVHEPTGRLCVRVAHTWRAFEPVDN